MSARDVPLSLRRRVSFDAMADSAGRRRVAAVADLAQDVRAAPGDAIGAVGAHGVEAVGAAAHAVGDPVVGDDRVAAAVAGEVVGAVAAGDDVVAAATADRVGPVAAEQRVATWAADEHVGGVAAGDALRVDEVALAGLAVVGAAVQRHADRRRGGVA